jgi:hypothetical protein
MLCLHFLTCKLSNMKSELISHKMNFHPSRATYTQGWVTVHSCIAVGNQRQSEGRNCWSDTTSECHVSSTQNKTGASTCQSRRKDPPSRRHCHRCEHPLVINKGTGYRNVASFRNRPFYSTVTKHDTECIKGPRRVVGRPVLLNVAVFGLYKMRFLTRSKVLSLPVTEPWLSTQ